jgi:hypothetical protein
MGRWRRRLSLWVLAFFGLPPNHSLLLHSQIFDMVQYGNAFSVMELYKMPTYLRMFYYNKLVESKKKESEQVQNANNSPKQSKVRFKR